MYPNGVKLDIIIIRKKNRNMINLILTLWNLGKLYVNNYKLIFVKFVRFQRLKDKIYGIHSN